MNFKKLISQNSQSVNLVTLGMSIAAFYMWILILGYFGILIGGIIIIVEFRFLTHYEVFLDDESFYFSRFYYNEIKVDKKELIDVVDKKGYFNSTVFCLKMKDGGEFKFIGAPKLLLEDKKLSVKQILNEIVISNIEKNNIGRED